MIAPLILTIYIHPSQKLETLEVYEDWLTPEQYKEIFDSTCGWVLTRVGKAVSILKVEKEEYHGT